MRYLAVAGIAAALLFVRQVTGAPPAAARHYPQLNASAAEAWVLPTGATHGIGQYSLPFLHWRVAVRRGSFGTDTTDDYCSRVRLGVAQITDRPFAALFLLAVQNLGKRELRLQASSISLVDGASNIYTAAWFGPIDLLPGMLLIIDPGQTKDEYVHFTGLPRVASTYSLRIKLREGQSGTIGTYRVVPSGRNPCG